MKKTVLKCLSAIMAVTALFMPTVSAQEGDSAITSETSVVESVQNYKSDKISLKIHIEDAENLIPQNMVFGIYSPQKQFWGARHIWVADTAKDHIVTFDVPEYMLGETLYLTLFSGGEKIQYGFDFYKSNDMIPLQTFTYLDNENNRVFGNEFIVSATPVSGKYIKAFANGWELYFKSPAKLIDGVCMIPMYEYLDAMSMRKCAVVDEESGRVTIKANGHTVVFYIDGNDMYADGNVTYSDVTPLKINGVLYIPFRFLAESLGGTVTAENVDGILNVSAELKYRELKKSEKFVNGNNIKSRTDYLVWVSKSNFTVTVFKNEKGVWIEEKSFPCSIGAPDTPTITGQYEYYSRESRWSYPTYYVGPIMRFYNGYALHSTLLRYDGSNADGRLGKKISHGCVRLAPASINWMVDTVPLYSKIYITE